MDQGFFISQDDFDYTARLNIEIELGIDELSADKGSYHIFLESLHNAY